MLHLLVCLMATLTLGAFRAVQERLTAKEALAHPYFAPVRQQEALAQ